jgi:hypothetical protein
MLKYHAKQRQRLTYRFGDLKPSPRSKIDSLERKFQEQLESKELAKIAEEKVKQSKEELKITETEEEYYTVKMDSP